MKIADMLQKIEQAASLSDLQEQNILPEPYDDSGFFMIYYAKEDYRTALRDVVRYTEDGLRIYYDRHLETGEAHVNDFVAKAYSLHCRCVIFYLSEYVPDDRAFAKLCQAVKEHHIPYLSINLPKQGTHLSGARLAEGLPLDPSVRELVQYLFADQVTFIPSDAPYADKKAALLRAYEHSAMHFSIHEDFAVADFVKDLAEEEITIPSSVEIHGKAYPVKAVGAYAFSGCRKLRRISLPSTVEDIGFGCSNADAAGVFNNCESLREIVYPPHVKVLYGGMFCGCTALERLILNDSLTFGGHPGGTHFCTAPGSGTDLSRANLDPLDNDPGEIQINCTLAELHLPQSARIIARDDDAHQVRFVYVSDGEYISALVQAKTTGGSPIALGKDHVIANAAEVYLLNNNDDVERVTFPRDLTFGQKWLRLAARCANLKSMVLPETVAELEDCFSDCPQLEHVQLPDSLLAISGLSFVHCPALAEITFPKYLYEVDQTCFRRTGLRTITSDSIHSKRLFTKHAYVPMMINGETNAALRLYLLAIYAFTSIGLIAKSKKEFPFYLWTDVTTIYITEQVKPFEIEGFTQTDSDRAGYRRYDCRWSTVERLKLMKAELK